MTLEDADLPAFAAELGIPGLFDTHVHFLPPRVMDKVWGYFDAVGPLTGRPWPIRYRWPVEERADYLGRIGVLRYSALPYAHKPGIAEYLNTWSAEFAAAHGNALRSATFYPEPEAASYVRARIEAGVDVFKTHVQVGDFDPTDPLLDDVWGALSDSQTPVVVHAGSGPAPGTYTGPELIGKVMAAFPNLPMIVAHMGIPEYEDFLAMAERYPQVRLDTTMVFTDFTEETAPYPRDLLARLRDLQPRVLLGSDFPNIPYAYAHQVEGLVRLDLGDDWLRDVLWRNGLALFDA
ncbi:MULTISPECIES: amidohydrolase family protein [Mumia]|uniref:amidohydrolase family protein n=1 Tax=Mumia TaxID=1546255 RepID=UPI001420F63B|nr:MULTISPECIES: amidohydrolase family protein [unclassified Mumia]QMW65524.1 amidohydrolase [Mumia sp. ZJ1417]